MGLPPEGDPWAIDRLIFQKTFSAIGRIAGNPASRLGNTLTRSGFVYSRKSRRDQLLDSF